MIVVEREIAGHKFRGSRFGETAHEDRIRAISLTGLRDGFLQCSGLATPRGPNKPKFVMRWM
jgi:hypothetical protein